MCIYGTILLSWSKHPRSAAVVPAADVTPDVTPLSVSVSILGGWTPATVVEVVTYPRLLQCFGQLNNIQ